MNGDGQKRVGQQPYLMISVLYSSRYLREKKKITVEMSNFFERIVSVII